MTIEPLLNSNNAADIPVSKYISSFEAPIAQNGFGGRNPWGAWGRRISAGMVRRVGALAAWRIDAARVWAAAWNPTGHSDLVAVGLRACRRGGRELYTSG